MCNCWFVFADVNKEEEKAVKCTWIQAWVPDVKAAYNLTRGRVYILGTKGHTNGLWFQLDIYQTVRAFGMMGHRDNAQSMFGSRTFFSRKERVFTCRARGRAYVPFRQRALQV